MSKLNRREYLMQMAAVSALTGMSKLISTSAASAEAMHPQSTGREKTTKAAFLFTPKTPSPPNPTNLTVLFGGLMGFSNTNNGEAHVGFQKGNGKHRLEINFYQTIGGRCFQLPPITANDLAGVKTIELTVRDQPVNVSFFHKDDFERKPTDDPRDFGWVLDFEDSLLYPGGVTLIKKFSPILKLSQGILYTHQLTKSKFDLVEVPRNTVHETINQVSRLVASAIDIPAGKEAILKLDGETAAQLPYIPSVRYEIQFMNDCFNRGSRCKWLKPSDPDETVRNDFYMHYFMFKPKGSGMKKYGLMLKEQVAGVDLQMCPPSIMAATDEAPCMASGFGKQTGFD